jgi:polyphenol oxidase
MAAEFGSRPAAMRAAIGPAIGPCCYQVGEEVQAEFASRFPYASELFPRSRQLHLPEANRHQLLAAGLAPGSITVAELCTQCHPEQFFSYRGEQGNTGRMLAFIGVRA